MSLYVGINNKPKAITSLLIGKNNEIKEASSAYTGGGVNSNLSNIYEGFNLNRINPVKELTSGKITKDDIGKTVYISNSAITCQEWRIADVNHDGTSGTVDLFSKHALSNTMLKMGGIEEGNIWRYTNSDLRKYLNGTVYNGFTDSIKNAIINQAYTVTVYAGSSEFIYNYLSDKVKCPSINELGIKWNNIYQLAEGQVYPIFKKPANIGGDPAINPLALFTLCDGVVQVGYWTRDIYGSNQNSFATIDSYEGKVREQFAGDGCWAVCCIRFGKK